MTQREKFQEIADNIRTKTRRTSEIIANNFYKEILNIPCNYDTNIIMPLGFNFSNFNNAMEAIKVAMTYIHCTMTTGEGDSYEYSEGEGCLMGDTEAKLHNSDGDNIIDNATFIGLVLRGITYENSPYYKQKGSLTCNPLEVVCDTTKTWTEEYFDLQTTKLNNPWVFPEYDYYTVDGCMRLLSAADIAMYYDRMGYTWFAGDMEPRTGDLCFFYEENEDDLTLTYPTRFLGIVSVGIMIDPTMYYMASPDSNKIIDSYSVEEKAPFFYARPPYGAIKDGESFALTPEKINLIPDSWASLSQGTTDDGILEYTLEGKKLTVSTIATQSSDAHLNIIWPLSAPIALPIGKYRLTGFVNNTGKYMSIANHEYFGMVPLLNSKNCKGVQWSADKTTSIELDSIADIGGGCEFTVEEDNSHFGLVLELGSTVNYKNLVVDPVLVKLDDDTDDGVAAP